MSFKIPDGEVTRGEEFNNGVPIVGASIRYSRCEYCGRQVIAVRDRAKSNNFPYLGNQAAIGKNYLYSPAVEAIRSYYGVGWLDYKNGVARENGPVFKQSLGNNLLNIHSRLHVRKKGSRKLVPSWYHVRGGGNYRNLCNECFGRTKSRVKIKGPGQLIYDVTVLPGETVEQVVEECQIFKAERNDDGSLIIL